MTVLVVAIIVFVGIVLIAEIALRLMSSKIRLRDWGSWEMQNKINAMDRLATTGGASVVCVGASHVQVGIDPALMTELLGSERPAFNAAINGCGSRMVELWVRDVILPKLKPDLLIYGIGSELTDNSVYAATVLRRFRRSPGWLRMRNEGSAARRLVYSLESVSYLARYRWLLPRKRREKKKRGALVSDLGYLQWVDSFREFEYGISDLKANIWRDVLQDFSVGGPEMQALGRLVDLLRDAGVGVLLVQMPVRMPDWLAFHPNGRQDFDDFEQVTRAFVAEHDVPFMDMMPQFSPEEFADPVHLNRSGQEKLTRMLVEASRERLAVLSREATPGR
jgi:hypothetical protein